MPFCIYFLHIRPYLWRHEEAIKAAFVLLPSLENDQELRGKAQERFKESIEQSIKYKEPRDKGYPVGAVTIIETSPKSFFSFEEVRPIAVAALQANLRANIEYKWQKQNFIDSNRFVRSFHLTEDEKKTVVDEVLTRRTRKDRVRP